ncbi:hypothetical protein MTBPR1_200028 [Candidatus Terasakiella magnetica]|uniref:Uncharacterized protein n=1 Tax=Candidatus Terasakiella magnetica TaxID=1867952 RepID=A0A1C3RH18_9PROT|nr:hypothetical protein MTBPR1_200028 [Candidatus Terasakiella magnetica]
MQSQPRLVTFNPLGASCAFGRGFIFMLKTIRNLLEGLFVFDQTLAVFVSEIKEPILSKVFGTRQAFFFGR